MFLISTPAITTEVQVIAVEQLPQNTISTKLKNNKARELVQDQELEVCDHLK